MEYRHYLISYKIKNYVDSIIYVSDSMKTAINSFMKDFDNRPYILSITVLDKDITEEDLGHN